jgi:hypothetical protein
MLQECMIMHICSYVCVSPKRERIHFHDVALGVEVDDRRLRSKRCLRPPEASHPCLPAAQRASQRLHLSGCAALVGICFESTVRSDERFDHPKVQRIAIANLLHVGQRRGEVILRV